MKKINTMQWFMAVKKHMMHHNKLHICMWLNGKFQLTAPLYFPSTSVSSDSMALYKSCIIIIITCWHQMDMWWTLHRKVCPAMHCYISLDRQVQTWKQKTYTTIPQLWHDINNMQKLATSKHAWQMWNAKIVALLSSVNKFPRWNAIN